MITRILPFFLLIFWACFLVGCQETKKIQSQRLTQEAIEIHDETLRAILKNDLKFMRSLDEQERFFQNLRKDLKRCREIEGELRDLGFTDKLPKLAELTNSLLELIEDREQRLQRDREMIAESSGEGMEWPGGRATLQEVMASAKAQGEDTSWIEMALRQMPPSPLGDDNDDEKDQKARNLAASIKGLEQSIKRVKEKGLDSKILEESLRKLREEQAQMNQQ